MTEGTYISEKVVAGSEFTVTVNGTAAALTKVPLDATRAIVSFSVASRIRLDGLAPTTTVGMPMAAAEKLELSGKKMIDNFRFIAVSTAGTLDVIYFKAA